MINDILTAIKEIQLLGVPVIPATLVLILSQAIKIKVINKVGFYEWIEGILKWIIPAAASFGILFVFSMPGLNTWTYLQEVVTCWVIGAWSFDGIKAIAAAIAGIRDILTSDKKDGV